MRIVRDLSLLILLSGILYFVFHEKKSIDPFKSKPKLTNGVFIFPDVSGPADTSVVQPFCHTSWKKYANGDDYGIAIFLTDTNSSWLGLVHTFKSFGIPFKLCTNADSALKNDVVYIYPYINSSVNENDRYKLSRFPRKGGILIGQCMEEDIDNVFGFKKAIASDTNFSISIRDSNNRIMKEFTDPKEKEISLGNEQSYKRTLGTYGYSGLSSKPLMVYPNGQAFLTEKDFPGNGKALLFGMDIGFFSLLCEDDKSCDAGRTYVNDFEPSLDVLIRTIKNIYTSSSRNAVTLGTVPYNKKFSVCFTHDIDYSRSMINALTYAQLEHSRNIAGTYFIQTKYIRDWNDVDFFNDSAVYCIRVLDSLKMELGSHSVAHSEVYNDFPIGTGTEKYPVYHPFVKSKFTTINGSVLGELRVSKFLLEHFVKNLNVTSFRPGHLSLPISLPQCLIASGFKYGSDVTANDVLTHLPYQLNYNRSFDEELPAFEFPITIEDEAPPDMDKRLNEALAVAHKIARYGGFWCCLIHPNVISYKYKFEAGFLDSIKNTAYISTIRNFAEWWSARNNVRYFVRGNKTGYQLHIVTPAPVSNLTFFIPSGWVCTSASAEQTGNSVLVKNITNGMTVDFVSK